MIALFGKDSERGSTGRVAMSRMPESNPFNACWIDILLSIIYANHHRDRKFIKNRINFVLYYDNRYESL